MVGFEPQRRRDRREEETDDATVERREGPTPNGGAYSVAYFRDAAGNPAPKSRAARVEIHECRADGASIFRTYGEIPRT